ncbi:hypothetical protein LMG27952_01975 [Paraburkholderia hiiakae]|uniref:Uncharacterized protein n=1 Tax=Paraburkholderia hiiakae TaxID=1081782 RepID=A0ABN7HM28_9BURK|nr:hypothetical protein [Paraburkholderia hiiakae]CAD6526942.1 hypothetical protein LMG27952_01975 [Paraburkholderia hiiakae]
MKNSNKFFVSIFSFFITQFSWGGQGVFFDNPGLIAFDANGIVSGYYDAEGEKRGCVFLFAQGDERVNYRDKFPYAEVKLLTFIPGENDLTFSGRSKTFDIDGELYVRGDTWLIRTDTGQAGCENSLGVFMSLPADTVGGAIFTVKKRIPAKGIRLVKKKSLFYDRQDGKFIERKGYLTRGNGVIVLQVNGEFAYVRFADPRTNVQSFGKVTTGWIRSADLVNPFPPAAKR